MPLYEITAPDGKTYEIQGPPGATQEQVAQAVLARNPMAGMTTAELEKAPSAPFSFGDVSRALGMGVTGGVKSIADVFGAGSGVSNYLGQINQELQKGLTPARQEEMTRRQELVNRAQEKGLGSEIYANLAGIAEAPIQSTLQAVGSSVPSILAGLAVLPEAAPAGIVLGVEVASRALMGAVQGVGETKGDIHDQIKQAYKDKNYSDEEAEKKAVEAQAYTVKTAPLLIGGAAFGALDAATGIQSSASRALRSAIHPETKALVGAGLESALKGLAEKPLEAPTALKSFLHSAAEEAIPEGLQGAFGQYAQNVAMKNEGFETPTMQGVIGSGARDLLAGALAGGVFSPMAHAQAIQDVEADKTLRNIKAQKDFEAERQAAINQYNKNIQQTKANLNVQNVLALPAPAEKAEEKAPEVDRLNNPLGNLTKDELNPEVVKYIDQYRKENNLPKLKEYSIEDVKDAMTNINPAGEQGALDSFIVAKTGYTGEQKYTPDDVINAAVKNNVATGTNGFNDFLTRTTGTADLNAMSQPQLHSAFKALMDLNRTPDDKELILPQGTNAKRFTEKQYNSALKFVNENLTESKPLNDVITDIKDASNLENDRDAQSLLKEAVKNGDLTQTSKDVFNVVKDGEVVSTHDSENEAKAAVGRKKGLNIEQDTVQLIGPKEAEVAPETVRTPLPSGYEIQKETLKAGEEPAGHAIIPEGQQQPLTTVPTLEGIQEKINQMQGARQSEAARLLADVQKHTDTLNKNKNELTRMEALGQSGTEAYKKLSAQQARAEDILARRIKRTYDQIERLKAPLKTKPIGKKTTTREVHTVIKDGKKIGSFPSNDAALKSIVTQLSDKELSDLASDKRKGPIKSHAQEELDLREAKAQGKQASPGLKERLGLLTPEATAKIEEIKAKLLPLLAKFGLRDVGLKIVKSLENNAEGSYLDKLITIAYTADNPIQTMRHEALHALKNLGFFTDAQWESLKKQAREVWVDKYLKGVNAKLDGKVMSRYDAYAVLYERKHGNLDNFEEEMLEEAIADAFGDFEVTKPPPGMLAALFKRLQNFFKALKQAFTGAGFESPEDIFNKIERGELVANQVEPNSWKSTKLDIKKAEDYFDKHGVYPYLSDGQQDVPLESEDGKLSLKKSYSEKDFEREKRKQEEGKKFKVLKNDPITGLPMNQDGTVTLYYPTTNEGARELARTKKLKAHSDNANKIYLTNESSAPRIQENPGMIEQPVGGANVLLKVDPTLIHLAQEYEDGRKDFFIPIAEGGYFAKKIAMTKMFTLNAPRTKGLHPDRTLSQVTDKINETVDKWQNASAKERAEMSKGSKSTLMYEHNISNLFGANSKLEKTNIGDYGLTYDGKKVMSTGLGFASAQKINDQQMASTCPKSAICEALCLGETSGQNRLYGGEGQFRSGPRLAQYLKTEALIVNPEAFTVALIKQISAFRKAAKELDYHPAIRLNVTSDFKPSTFEAIIKMFPDVTFYDYTKLETQPIAPNHHLTYSSTGASQIVKGKLIYNQESNWDRMVDKFLNKGKNVAMAFTSRDAMPKYILDERTGERFEVWNGDEYDARFLDPIREDGKGWIIGLTNKDNTTKPEDAAKEHNGFFLDYEKERDGDELKILDQNKLKPGKTIEFIEKQKEKLSLKTYFPTAEEAEKAAYKKAPPETHEFKLFFGASKAMEDGRPQVMYHGTDRDITQFRENAPIFVSPDAEFAEQFAERRVKFKDSATKKIYPLWVRSETPFDYENPDHVNMVMNYLKANNLADQNLEAFKKFYPNTEPTLKIKLVSNAQEKVSNIEKSLARGDWRIIEDGTVQNALKALGFDSFHIKEQNIKQLAVFSANQIKSVTGNVGDFGANKDIRFSLSAADSLKIGLTDKRIDNLIDTNVYTQSDAEKKTKAYIAYVSPKDFLNATISKNYKETIEAEKQPLDLVKLKKESQPIVLFVEESKGKKHELNVKGHEGRHRMMALRDAGFEQVPVVFQFSRGENREPIDDLYLHPQKFYENNYGASGFVAESLTPINYENINVIKEKFSQAETKYSLPSVRKDIEDRINETTTTREEKGFAQRITEALSPQGFSYFRQKALNRYNRLSEYDKLRAEKMGGAAFLADQSAEGAALLSDLGAGVTASALGFGDRNGGIPVYKNGFTTIDKSIKGLVAALSPLARYGDPKVYQRFQYWAGSIRGYRLDAEGREHNFTAADYAFAKELEKQHPEFKQVMKDYTAFNNGVVKYLVDTGVISEEQGKEYTKYADYIPFYRQMDGEQTIGPNIFHAISGVKQPKKLKGGEAPLADFLETVVRNTQSAINAGMKNQAAQRAVKVALDLNNIERLNTVASGPDIIEVLEKGKKTYYRTPDNLFVDAIKSLNMPELPFMSLISAPSNLLRNFVTKDPGFMLANMMRDSLSAWVTSGQDSVPFVGTFKQFGKSLAGKSKEFDALIDAGVLGGYEFSQNVKASGRLLEKDLSRKNAPAKGLGRILSTAESVWDALEKGTTASDAATRALVYERVLRETGNEAEAIYRALEVMNFNRKGNSPVVRILTAAVPFLNARFQGLDVFWRTASGGLNNPDAKKMQAAFIKRGLLLMGLTAMYYASVQGDPDYEKQEEETKDNYWILPQAGVKIPIPFEVGVLFKVIPERILSYYMGNSTGQDLLDSAARNLSNTFAFNPIPQAVKPIVEDMTNFNFFTMRPIVGQGMEGLEAKYQIGPGTSITAKKLGEIFDHSPLKIDNMIRGYFGAVGTYATDLIDSVLDAGSESPKASKRLEQMAVFKRFMVDPEARGNITAYYALKDQVDTAVKTANYLKEAGSPEEFQDYMVKNQYVLANKDYINELDKSMKAFRDMRKRVNGMQATPDEKREMLIEIGHAENNLTENIKEVKKLIASQ